MTSCMRPSRASDSPPMLIADSFSLALLVSEGQPTGAGAFTCERRMAPLSLATAGQHARLCRRLPGGHGQPHPGEVHSDIPHRHRAMVAVAEQHVVRHILVVATQADQRWKAAALAQHRTIM